MNHPFLTRILLPLAAAACSMLAPLASAEPGPRLPVRTMAPEDLSNARVIVKYRADSAMMRALSARSTSAAGVQPLHAASLAQRLSLPLRDGHVLGSRVQSLQGAGLSSAQLAQRLAALPDVEWAVVDERRGIAALPNDPYFNSGQAGALPPAGQWYLRAPTAALPSAINAAGAWDITTGSPSLTVAVLDTGVRLDHPDLDGKLLPGYDFVSDSSYSNDGNGRDADPNDPGDWTTNGYCGSGASATSSSWHGTQVAGLIGAATNNGVGIAGTAWNVKVLPVRVLGRCGGEDSDIIAGMRWAAGLSADPYVNPNPARVINMSLGSPGTCSAAYREVIADLNAAGVTVVVAGGNAAGLPVFAPANCPGAIAVAGVRHLGSKVGYSNLGPQMAIAAPAGNCVNDFAPCLYPLMTSTNSGGTAPAANTYSDGSNYSVGTSFAAPLVAGTAALMLSVDPALTPASVTQVLQASARPFPASGSSADVTACRAPTTTTTEQLECYCTTATCGAGMLDAAAAVAQVRAALVLAPVAAIRANPAAPTAGTAVTLTSEGSSASAGRSIAGYGWAITAGSGIASFSGATDGAAATLQTSGAGSVTVQLTVTDSAGASSSTSTTLTISAAPVTPATSGGGGGGGGGALGWAWSLGLAAAWLLLRSSRARALAERA